jgi:hypothetical protein
MSANDRNDSRRFLPAAFRSLPKGARLGIGLIAVLLVLLSVLFAASYFLDEPLRRSTEERMNRNLKGYAVRLPKLHFQLVGLTMTLQDLRLYQQANPDPPVAHFPLLRFRVHWVALLHGKLVAEFLLDRPNLWINLPQIRAEAASRVKFRDRGWQEALAEIYPFKINRLRVRDGTFTYIDKDPDRPLRLSGLDLEANNIRNVISPGKVYPSTFRMKTAVFGAGKGTLEGKADFLAEPHLGFNARIVLENVPLDYFKPVISRANLSINNGIFSGSGRVEYSPDVKAVHLDHLTVQGMELDYVHTAEMEAAEKKAAKEVGEAVKQAPKSEMEFLVDEVRVQKCTVGMKNENAKPPYRVYLADADFRLTNLSNKFAHGPAEMSLGGKFMGSGPTTVKANFRPETEGPDLDLSVRIDDTRLTDMNDLFRAYGKFDVSEGTFAFVSELRVKNNAISGYMKPFFKNMKVYDRRADKEKRTFRKLYEMLVGGVSKLLESRRRGEVAAKADISGPVGKPKISNWQIVGSLIRNAFFRAILPEFEREVSGKNPPKENVEKR